MGNKKNRSKKFYLFILFILIVLVVSINIANSQANRISIEVLYIFEDLDQVKYDNFFEGLNKFGVRYTISEEKDGHILHLSKIYNNISDVSFNDFFATPETSTSKKTANHFLISTSYQIQSDIYLEKDEREGYINYSDSDKITNVILSMKIPYKISEHNAGLIDEETNELIWNLKLGEKNDIVITILDYNISLILGMFVLLLLIILIIFGYIKKSKSRY
ncbi:MAG: hypothetical protein AB7V16_04070 [Vulcanibacillus sp.]